MGDRASVSFRNGNRESVTLFSHQMGSYLWAVAEQYTVDLKRELSQKQPKHPRISQPLDRLEPETVMTDFVRYMTYDCHRVVGDLYLGRDPQDGDNSDNGHRTIELEGAQDDMY